MSQHMVRYTLKPGQAARNEELVRDVLDELRRVRPAGLRFGAFRLDDGVSFIHLVRRDTEPRHGAAAKLPALKAFHAGVGERCEVAPVRTELAEIGAFRLFGEV